VALKIVAEIVDGGANPLENHNHGITANSKLPNYTYLEL